MIRIYFVKGWGWSKPGDGTPPDFVVNDGDELMALVEDRALADGATTAPRTLNRLEPSQRDVLRALAGRVRRPATPIDVLANAAVYQILPRT